MKKNLYRASALNKLRSPERLNEMIRVTSTRSWLALLAFMAVIGVFTAWGIFGSIPRNVGGQGILIRSGGVVEVSSISFGKLTSIVQEEGDYVEKNHTIAYIDQPELSLQIENAQKRHNEMNFRFKMLKDFDTKDFELKEEVLNEKLKILDGSQETNKRRLAFIAEQIANQEQLLNEGLITKATLINTRLMQFEIQQENEKLRNDQKAIELELFEVSKNNEISLHSLEDNILELERDIEELQAKYKQSNIIVSPYTGKVVEIMVNKGEVINIGSTVMTIEVSSISQELTAVVYIPPSEGKKVEIGMKVKVAPSTVKVEEFGFIEGIVTGVSDYPSTRDGMERVLGNNDLVQAFSQGVPPIAVQIALHPDKLTFSGYKWTSQSGPNVKIKSGTLCQANIIVKTHRPITLLFPAMEAEMELLEEQGL